ncbi:hypothetical protein VFPPC_05633 [Pochonia chlamydosporia 170]|uniref:RNA helicase n=1 Tax=Pochonia chlamydosporia 170 TaxID=1380566 RepID=A0A179FGH2_METCM|nr:hypothetical protein VFPPC_05633 [Pochonia chlamydosporia 170]OAQ64351.1 hypothetical protein VFPPC_05633 [Pochonia chlamydosporia 170]
MILEPGTGTNCNEAIQTYEELHLKDALTQAMRERPYTSPRIIQRHVLKPIMDARDVLVQVPGFADQMDTMIIGTLQRIDPSIPAVQALWLTSTREVADRIRLCGSPLCESMGLKLHACIAAYGSPRFKEELEMLHDGAHIVTGTPGRVHDLIRRRAFKPDKITTVVLHRANDIFSYRLGDQFYSMLKDLPPSIQLVALCEGDMEGDDLHALLARMSEPVRLVLNVRRVPSGSKHFYVCIEDQDDRFDMLKALLEEVPPNKTSIFCSTREQVDVLADKIRGADFPNVSIYNDVDQHVVNFEAKSFKRDSSVMRLEDGDTEVGLSSANIGHSNHLSLLVNYILPVEDINYATRLEREKRLSEGGVVVNFVSGSDLASMRAIGRTFGIDVDILPEDFSSLLFQRKDGG